MILLSDPNVIDLTRKCALGYREATQLIGTKSIVKNKKMPSTVKMGPFPVLTLLPTLLLRFLKKTVIGNAHKQAQFHHPRLGNTERTSQAGSLAELILIMRKVSDKKPHEYKTPATAAKIRAESFRTSIDFF